MTIAVPGFSGLRARWIDAASLALSVWVAVSPFIVDQSTVAAFAWNLHFAGAAAIVAALLMVFRTGNFAEYALAAIGAWLVVAPWLLGFAEEQTPSRQTTFYGIVLVSLAIWAIRDTRARTGGGGRRA